MAEDDASDSEPVEGSAQEFENPPPMPVPAETTNNPVSTPAHPWGGISRPGEDQLTESEDRTWGMLCHLASFGGLLLPSLGNILGPLIVWLIKRDASPFVDIHGKESLNFQISITLYLLLGGGVVTIISLILALLPCFGLVGVTLLAVALSGLAIFAVVYQVIAAIRASEGGFLRYPLTLRFFR